VWLGKLLRCVVSHDSKSAGQGWYCEQILVREGPFATHEYVFPCRRYVAWVKSIMVVSILTAFCRLLLLSNQSQCALMLYTLI